MPVTRAFSTRATLKQIAVIMNSLGAHVAAKLGHFGTDERTLTDDLCDMFYIWAQEAQRGTSGGSSSERALINALPSDECRVTFSKMTQQEEASVGADLALRIETPMGVKRALIQAKVYDPQDDRLRCDSPAEWDRLWSQLVLMRTRSPLAFLLIYVPASKLDGANQGISTWEQGFVLGKAGDRSSKFGATLVPVEDLLDGDNNWRFCPPVRLLPSGYFNPDGISLCRLVVEMILCRRGKWWQGKAFPAGATGPLAGAHTDSYPVHYRPYREIGMGFTDVTPDDWGVFTSRLEERLNGIDLS